MSTPGPPSSPTLPFLLSLQGHPTIGNQHFDPNSGGVPNSGASGIIPIGVVLCNGAVEHDVAVFLELFLATRWRERLRRG